MIIINLLKGALLGTVLFAQAALAGEPVNINSADAQTLANALDGVGLSKARAIVAYRTANGPFKHADELVNIKGIGLATVDRNRDYILLKPGKQVAKQP